MMIQFTITMAAIMLVSFYSFVSVQSFSYVTSSAFVTNTAAAEAATVSASERIPARNIGSSSSGRNGNTVLSMAGGGGVRRRGLEQRRETITPTEEGMILYVKAGEDGTSVGDCPFSHYVRMVLEEKSLSYELRPTTHDTKPNWLLEYYDGQLPALRHQKECYIESDVIVAFLNYFFPAAAASEDPDQLHPDEAPDPVVSQTNLDTVEGSVLDDSFFPTMARYLKDVNDTAETEDALIEKLGLLENHFKQLCRTTCTNSVCPSWCYLDGTQTNFDTKLDCRLLPQLYHLSVGIAAFKSSNTNKSEDTKDDADDDDDTDNDVPTNDNNNNNPINLKQDYPYVYKYMMAGMERPSFVTTKYSSETIVWGWTNARKYQ